MAAALRAVRGALGADALILETRPVPDSNGGGIEILALSETETAETTHAPEVIAGARSNDLVQTSPIDSRSYATPPSDGNGVREEMAALRSMLSWLAPGFNHENQILKSLMAQGLNPEIMARLSDAMHHVEGADEREKTYRALTRLIPTGGQIPDAVDRLALIGPTGVGKTSSIIKLTVFESQRLLRSVGWLNCDTRRIASGDPLALYATILGVRYETATDAKEAKRALDRLSDCDLILVDTPGVGPRDDKGIKELGRLLQALPGLRRTLLLSASTNGHDLAEWVKNYRPIAFDSLFFTKLDECRYFGPLINTAMGAGYPLSYITLGQSLAGDLEAARAEVLTSLLMSRSHNHD